MIKLNKITIILTTLFTALVLNNNAIAEDFNNNIDTTVIEKVQQSKIIPLEELMPILSIKPEERATYIKNIINKFDTDLVYINYQEKNIPISVTAFLLLNELEDLAVYLIDAEIVQPMKLFKFENNEMSDLIIAIENDYINFFDSALRKLENVNQQYKYNGEEGFSLLMHTAIKKNNTTYHMTYSLIKKGANENLSTYNNMTPLKLAKIENNRLFINAISDYRDSLIKSKDVPEHLMKNTSLSVQQIREQVRILNNFQNGLLDKVFEDKEEYSVLNSMIMMGYNDVADLILNRLKEENRFNANFIGEDGLSPLMSAAASDLSGGNVEYAHKLINNGADVNLKNSDGINAAQISVSMDNAKVLLLLLENNVNIFEKNIDGEDLFEQAINNKPASINSALVIKRYAEMLLEYKKTLN